MRERKSFILNKQTILLRTFVMKTALIKSTGLTESITNVSFHPLINLNPTKIQIFLKLINSIYPIARPAKKPATNCNADPSLSPVPS